MKTGKPVLVLSVLLLMLSTATGKTVEGNFTGDNFTDSYTYTPVNISEERSVNQFGENIANISLGYQDNQTTDRTFTLNLTGNASKFLDSPSAITVFNNESTGFPLVANIPVDQNFGFYNATLSFEAEGNQNFSDSIPVEVSVFDDVKPDIEDVQVVDVQALTSDFFNLSASDNLEVDRATVSVQRVVDVVENNETVKENKTIVNQEMSEGIKGEYSFKFKETNSVGQYYTNFTVYDTSNNSKTQVEGFKVEGLDSIKVLDTNFVFDTILPKESTGFELVKSEKQGKEFTVKTLDLSYGGNESVEIGVKPPSGDSPEIVDVNESRSYTSEGVYDLVLIHQGDNEIKGTHSVTGEVQVLKPRQHVKPRNLSISFSGTVKNLDKPPAECLQVAEFNSCIGYSFDNVQKMFEDEYGETSGDDKGFVWKISRLPTSEVEGEEEWSGATQLTMGEYTKIKEEKHQAVQAKGDAEGERNLAIIFVLFYVFVSLSNSYGKGVFEAEKKIPKDQIGQEVEKPEEIQLGRV